MADPEDQPNQSEPTETTAPGDTSVPEADASNEPEAESATAGQPDGGEAPPDTETEEKPPEESAEEKPSDEATEEKPAEEVTEEKPAEEATEEKPAEEATEEKPAEEATEEKPAEEATEEKPAEEVTEEKPAEEATEEKPAEEATEEKPAEEATEEKPAAEATAEKPAEEGAEKPAEEATAEKPAEEATAEKPAEEGAEKPAEEATAEKPAEEGAEKPAEEKNTEKSGEDVSSGTGESTKQVSATDDDSEGQGGVRREQDEKRKKKKEKPQIPEDFFYEVEDWVSKPKITEDSGLPSDILKLHHSFGYDCLKRNNICLLDDEHICYIAGNLLEIFGLKTKEQRYLRSSSGGGIGAITVHKSHQYFAVGEKGESPNVLIYTYPELKLYRILRGGTQTAYANLKFSPDGSLLATVGSEPDFMLTVWDWRNEQTVLRCKAFSQDIFSVSWSAELEGFLTTAGTGHVRFWKMADTFTGLKLQGYIGKFGKTEISDIEGYVELPDGKVLSGCEWGNMLIWDGGLIKVEVTRKQKKPCHNGPIQQIVMDEGELMTVGIDGFIRTWDFEAIDTAEASDESAYFELEPMNEMRVDNDVRLKHIVKCLEEDSTIWYAQDANGAIWKLDLSFSHTSLAPERISSFHAGAIVGCATSPISYLAATIGHDSSVKIYDFAAKKIMSESHFIGHGSSIIWAPQSVDSKGKTILAGFSDGVVRVLNFGENPELDPTRKARQMAQLDLVVALKPHSSSVRAMAITEDGDFLVTGADDQTIFFFTIAGTSYDPIGFISVPGAVQQLEWIHREDKLTVLVFLRDGSVCEVVAPDPENVDHSKTFEIEGLKPHQSYTFRSIKSRLRHEEDLERQRLEEEERKKKEEEERRIRRERGLETEEDQQQKEEEEKERERKRKEEEEAWEPYIPEEPSPILKAFVNKSNDCSFWLSMGEFDAGYLYQCNFASPILKETKAPEVYDEPGKAVPVVDSFDVPVCDIHFSCTGKRAILGMEDGSIRITQLEQPFDLGTMGPHWTLTMHDNNYGRIAKLVTSYDDKFLLSVGADGNFFVDEMMSEDLQDQKVQEYKAKIPSARKMEGPKPDDIDDPNAYSIEEHKQKSEHDRMVKLAEEKKVATRRRIQDLRKDFKKLKDQNEALPERTRIAKTELDLVPELREDLIHSRNEKIEIVHKEMAWESEKHQIALDKLRKRFREYVQCDMIIVRAFLTRHEVRTNRAANLSDDFYRLKQEMERRVTNLSHKDATRDPTLLTQADGAADLEGQEGLGGEIDSLVAKSSVKGARGERIARQLKKLEEKRKRRALRRSQWQTLYNNKPDDDYEDPKDVQAIKEAKENMGDFKLKTASDYVVPDHLRMNTDKARNRLVEVEEKIHDLKYSINERILQLREKKMGIIEEIKTMVARLVEIQKDIPVEERRKIPPVPEMIDDELPEKKYEYTRGSLLEFKKEMEEKRLAELRGEEPSSFGAFTKQPAAAATGPRRPQRAAEKEAAAVVAADTGIASGESPGPALSPLQQSRSKIQRARLLYEQDLLLSSIDQSLRHFDAELRLVRHDKMQIDTRLKKAELRQLTLYEEYLLLKEFEKSEKGLADRVEQKQAEKIEMQGKVSEYQIKLEAKKKDIEKLQEKEKALHETFKQSLGENNKFADYLTKVFKKKIKRKKKETEGGDSDEEDESSDDDDSEWDESEEESDEEGITYDLDMCPAGCDQQLYDNTCQLREKRLDFEEELAEEKKILDALKKESENLQKKSKAIDAALKHAENDLEEFQLKKQKKLNELDVIVILKLHQLLYHENGVLPSDLVQTLVFERTNLMQLRRRIKELEEEKQQQKRQQKEAKRRHIQLMKDRKVYQAHINEMQEQCDNEMKHKFGKIEDMERLEQVIVNPKIEELTVKMLMLQEDQLAELMEAEDRMRSAKEHVIEQTRENTKHLTQMLMLYNERLDVEKKLNSRQKNLSEGSEYRGARPSDVEEMTRLVQLVQIQAQELNALKEEIGMLSRKGGHILPPVQPPMPPEKGPSVL